MTGHTEGKWVAREQENSFTIWQEHDGGKLIAETAPFFSYLGATAKERARADAELIANAPEMDARIKELEQQRDELLAALEAAIECGIVPSSSAKEGGAAKYARQVIVADQIRDAVTNARGAAK